MRTLLVIHPVVRRKEGLADGPGIAPHGLGPASRVPDDLSELHEAHVPVHCSGQSSHMSCSVRGGVVVEVEVVIEVEEEVEEEGRIVDSGSSSGIRSGSKSSISRCSSSSNDDKLVA